MPRVQALYDEYRDLGYEAIAINLGEGMATVKTYARQYSFLFLRDPNLSVWANYRMNGYIPLNYVIDTAQIVVNSMEGFDEYAVRSWIEPYLTGVAEPKTALPLSFCGVTPNPARGPASIRFNLAQAGNVSLRVYSSAGALVRTVYSGSAQSGSNCITWNLADNSGRPVANGLYVCELASGANVARTKVSVLR